MKNWLIGKDPDAAKDWRQEKKGTTEDEMVGWHHWLNGHKFWVSSGSWWWTGKPGVLQFMGSQRVKTRLSNWTELWPKQDITPLPEKVAHRGWFHCRALACYLESTFPVPKLWLPPPLRILRRPKDKKLLEFLKSFKYKEQWFRPNTSHPTNLS